MPTPVKRDEFRSRTGRPGEGGRRVGRRWGKTMKRTATTLALLAGFGGGCATNPGGSAQTSTSVGHFGRVTKAREIPGVTGPMGEPVAMTARPAGGSGVQQAAYLASGSSGIQQAGCTGPGCGPGGGLGGGTGNPFHQGILPVPGMGPPGAVAAVGALPANMPQAPTGMRTSIRFVSPAGMKVAWQLPGGGFGDEANALTTPAAYNFAQSQVYRLRLSGILPNYPGKTFYPTLEVVGATPNTIKFLAHSSVPVAFTNEDFDQASAGNMVVKVIYLPDRTFADFATVAGAEEIVSTRLDPGADPVAEAQKRGSILAILTLGNIDLENRYSPAMNQPPGFMGGPPPGMMVPPGAPVPPGAMPAPPAGPMAPAAPPMGAMMPPMRPTAPPGMASVTMPTPAPATLPALPAMPR